eukprot:7195108-Pyramimonas_sp.AAC.1
MALTGPRGPQDVPNGGCKTAPTRSQGGFRNRHQQRYPGCPFGCHWWGLFRDPPGACSGSSWALLRAVGRAREGPETAPRRTQEGPKASGVTPLAFSVTLEPLWGSLGPL